MFVWIFDVVGAHTFGRSRCRFFDRRLNVSSPDNTLDASYATQLRQACASSRDTFLNLDPTTPDDFDNNYYTNLQSNFGLLGSDQVLFSTPGEDTVDIVNMFAGSEQQFFDSFGQSMINMGNISPLTGDQGEVRCNCRRLNWNESPSLRSFWAYTYEYPVCGGLINCHPKKRWDYYCSIIFFHKCSIQVPFYVTLHYPHDFFSFLIQLFHLIKVISVGY